jgi:hypothetical protein
MATVPAEHSRHVKLDWVRNEIAKIVRAQIPAQDLAFLSANGSVKQNTAPRSRFSAQMVPP